jgi:hypothetical protein
LELLDNVSVPAPTLVNEKAPETRPESVKLPEPPNELFEPRVTEPCQVEDVPLVFIRAPPLEIPVPFNVNASVAKDVSEKPFISKTPPEETVVPVVDPNGPVVEDVDETPNFNVAFALTVVVPV